jgi:hypothetical protein
VFTLRPELITFTRACENLLSDGVPLTEDERTLLEYYVNDVVREFLVDKSIVSNLPQTAQTV